jgi:Lrp/AsnC family transcriptional regulator of lysine biosynthesis
LPAVDEVDMKILEILRKNARTPYTSLARDLNISEAAIRKRIEKLIRVGVVKRFTIDYELENEVKAAVLVKVAPPNPTSDISRRIVKINGVEMVYEVTGDYDILVIVRGKNINMINKSIDEIRSINGVYGTNSMIVLRVWY